MERIPLFQPEFMASDEALINGMYDGFSYQSLLRVNLDHHQNYNYGDVKPDFSLSSFHPYLTNNTPSYYTSSSNSQMQLTSPATSTFPLLMASSEDLDFQKMKLPKLEPVTDDLQFYDPYNNEVILNEPYNYFSNTSDFRLPDLCSIGQYPFNFTDFHVGESSASSLFHKVVKPVSVSGVLSNNFSKPKNRRKAQASSTNRNQKQKLSEKTRCLEKLLPTDKKMDTATMLEEAYKYVKFLQAQISVLQSMPVQFEGSASSYSSEDKNGKSSYGNEMEVSNVFGTLGRLNRQQLLQVILNSPKAQTLLYSKGCCVYSAEQLVLLRKIAQRNALRQQMLFFSGMLS